MSAKELAIQAPRLCGVPNYKRWERIAEFVWENEATDHKSVFARSEEDAKNEEERIDVLFGWHINARDATKGLYINQLLSLLLLRHYILEHGRQDLMGRASELEGRVARDEAKYPDVSALLTVEAAVKGFWT